MSTNSIYHLHIAQHFFRAMRATPMPATLPLYNPHESPDSGLYRYDENGIYAVYLETAVADTLLALFVRADEPGLAFHSVALIVNGQVIEDDRDPKFRTGGTGRLNALDNSLMREFAEMASACLQGPSMDGEIVHLCGHVRQYPDRAPNIHYWTGNPEHPFAAEVELAETFVSFNAATIMGQILERSRELLGVTDPEHVFTGMTVQLRETIANHVEPTPEELIASAKDQLPVR